MLRCETIYLFLKIKMTVEKYFVGQKTLKVAKNNYFTCLGWFFSVVVKNHKTSMYEFHLELVFLSYFFKKNILQIYWRPR